MEETEDQGACPDRDYHSVFGCRTCGMPPLLYDHDDWCVGDAWGPYDQSSR